MVNKYGTTATLFANIYPCTEQLLTALTTIIIYLDGKKIKNQE